MNFNPLVTEPQCGSIYVSLRPSISSTDHNNLNQDVSHNESQTTIGPWISPKTAFTLRHLQKRECQNDLRFAAPVILKCHFCALTTRLISINCCLVPAFMSPAVPVLIFVAKLRSFILSAIMILHADTRHCSSQSKKDWIWQGQGMKARFFPPPSFFWRLYNFINAHTWC